MNLYQCLDAQVPEGFDPNEAQRDILSTWRDGTALFSAGQVSRRNGVSKRSARRAIERLIALGLVKKWG